MIVIISLNKTFSIQTSVWQKNIIGDVGDLKVGDNFGILKPIKIEITVAQNDSIGHQHFRIVTIGDSPTLFWASDP